MSTIILRLFGFCRRRQGRVVVGSVGSLLNLGVVGSRVSGFLSYKVSVANPGGQWYCRTRGTLPVLGVAIALNSAKWPLLSR